MLLVLPEATAPWPYISARLAVPEAFRFALMLILFCALSVSLPALQVVAAEIFRSLATLPLPVMVRGDVLMS
jgi:hypothetical protein